MPSKITAGEVPVMLNDEEVVLKRTMRAMTQISRQYGGFGRARTELLNENFDAVVFIMRVGSGMSDRDAKDLGERIFENGITAELLVPMIRYVALLSGGKEEDDGEEGGNEDAPSGNVSSSASRRGASGSSNKEQDG